MRIVHDIDAEAHVSGGPDHPYAVPKGESGPSRGFRVTLLITSTSPFGKEEAIHVEGNARHIRDALVGAIGVVDTCGDVLVEEGALASDWRGEEPPALRVVDDAPADRHPWKAAASMVPEGTRWEKDARDADVLVEPDDTKYGICPVGCRQALWITRPHDAVTYLEIGCVIALLERGGFVPRASEYERVRAALHRDQTGLAAAMNEIRTMVTGASWLGDPEQWGSYGYEHHTIETLRKEAEDLIERVTQACQNALIRSGTIAQRVLAQGDSIQLVESDLDTKDEA